MNPVSQIIQEISDKIPEKEYSFEAFCDKIDYLAAKYKTERKTSSVIEVIRQEDFPAYCAENWSEV